MQIPNPSPEPEDIINEAMKKANAPAEDYVKDEDTGNGNGHEEDFMDTGEDDESVVNRRKFLRSEFTYPVEFKLFYQKSDHASFKGYLKDISISGACLQVEDRYGKFIPKELPQTKMKIMFSIPQGDKVSILALIKWVRKVDPKSLSLKMGIEFQELEPWQIEVIEKLINMRNKDHNMIWNLMEQQDNNWR